MDTLSLPLLRPNPPLFESAILQHDLLVPIDHLDRTDLGEDPRSFPLVVRGSFHVPAFGVPRKGETVCQVEYRRKGACSFHAMG